MQKSRSVTRRVLIAGAAASVVAAPGIVRAQAKFPDRPVKLIIPWAPGGPADGGFRILAELAAKKLGQPVVVENKAGASGVLGAIALQAEKPDGYTISQMHMSVLRQPLLNKSLIYNPINDLSYILQITGFVMGIVVRTEAPWKTLPELIAYAKANPGKLNWATITGFFDFVFDGFQKKMGLQIEKVPYRNTVQAATDLAEGRIQLMMSAYAILRPHVDSGKLKLLAITASQRASMLPDVPTVGEAGFPDVTIDGLVGLFGPKEMAPAVRERIAADVRDVLADPMIVQRLTATGQVVNPGGPQEFAQAMEKQHAQAAEAGRILGIKAAQ